MSEQRRRALIEEYLRRKEIRAAILASLHPQQRKVLDDPAQYRACCASRRGGKTWLDVSMITLSLMDSPKDVWTVFLAPTGAVGKELIWSDLLAMNEKYSLGWECKEHPTPLITTPAGAKFRILGVDDSAQLGKLRGKKYALVIADEAKEYTKFLQELVEEIVGPAFMGVGGRMVVSGTPGRACSDKDYWYSICHGLQPGWSAHQWTLHENKWIENPEEELRKVREQKGWSEDNAKYVREYLGKWVSDASERVYAYLVGRNSINELPPGYDATTWIHGLGIDFAYSPDPCAWVVLASHPRSRDVYVIHTEQHGVQLPDEAANVTARLVKAFRPQFVVGDSGGAGKAYVEEFNRRRAEALKTWIQAAKKQGKRDHQEILSEDLRAGLVKVLLGKHQITLHDGSTFELSGGDELALDLQNLGWKDEHREVENPGQPNHRPDAFLYAHVHHKAYFHTPAAPKPTVEEKERQELEKRKAAARAAQNRKLMR